MFGPWIVAFSWLKTHVPTKWSAFKPSFNFITLHYMYIIGMALVGSILLYPAGEMPYIDALFFASGAATQSGLNTIDLNQITLYQQVVIMLMACICTPIFINSFVVFIRLYWFEKRFQNVVMEARSLRRNKTRSRTKSQAKEDMDRDMAREESGVGDRSIVVLRDANGGIQGTTIVKDSQFRNSNDGRGSPVVMESKFRDAFEEEQSNGGSSRTQNDSDDTPPLGLSPTEKANAPFHRDIMFADQVRPSQAPEKQDEEKQSSDESARTPPPGLTNDERIPEKMNREKTIAFVENQRNPKDKAILRIPGPRDYDQGILPQRIEEDDALEKQITNEHHDDPHRTARQRSNSLPPSELNADDHPLKSHITIDVPDQKRRPGVGPTVPSAYGPSAYNMGRVKTAETGEPTPNMHLRNRSRSRTLQSFLSREKDDDPMPYLSWQPTVGRNSAFVDLTEDQREELGGIEYRALKLLAIILVCYFIGFHLLGMICLMPWMVRSAKYSSVVSDVGVSPVWWGIFTPASIFNDLGFTLTPDSMISFQFAVLPLTLGTFLIIIGNTGFPCMLRFTIWLVQICVPRGSGVWEELRFLLDHPRRCFTLLFPSKANWWLFWVLIALNGIDLIFFVVLDLNDPTVTSLPPGFRFLDGLFQAASTRTAGFSVVNLAELHPAIQVSYLIMMYISVFPIAISMRQTNVYEEKSLGVWADYAGEAHSDEANNSYLGQHLRRQLSFDLWFVFLGFFLIAIIEGRRLENTNDYAFTLFSVLFEIVSAYGTVGLSLGYPGFNTSFSGQFKTLSKLIIISMQIRGRHRGLPYALDRAILLPSESLHKKEVEDANIRKRRGSGAVSGGPDGEALFRPMSGVSRRSSHVSGVTDGEGEMNMGASKRRRPQVHVGRFLSGALSAGPSIPREKKA
ncbi:potassium transport protein TRK1/TRK2 [Amniculicola lignicola CBS 123094]|uniref:Potassium transport protein n=1 Tax=Amniculicola lignicola CBS 123094 TaxID=1392246 RepID=A0A6A5WDC3_9PLEO|nr:potassium transport protein TRK1/TRK2 [Amniculicola lignicola CBS 123094]